MLGPLEVLDDGDAPVVLGAPKLRAVLQLLALDAGHVVPTDRLIEDVWDHDPPPRALVSLRSYVSNLRAALRRSDGAATVVTRGQGYVLDVRAEELDTTRFERLAAAGRDALADGDPRGAVGLLDTALAMWRGPALADIAGLVAAAAPATRLEQLRTTAREDRLTALLSLGRHDLVVADAEELVRGEPHSERPHHLLAVALHRAGRTPEALELHRRFRVRLAEELGLDPSPEFTDLAARLLRHDPSLGAPARPTPPAVEPPSDAPEVTRRPAQPTAPTTTSTAPHWAEALGRDLVGRRREREHLAAAVDALVGDARGGGGARGAPGGHGGHRGRGGTVAVAGEAGIGKTSLLASAVLAAHEAGAVVAVGRCSETPGAPPFWPWTQVLEAVHDDIGAAAWTAALGDHGPSLALVTPQLVDAPPPEVATVDAQAARFTLQRAITDVLAAVAARRGLVVVIDDLHWADLASAELVAQLAAVAPDARLLLLTSYRDTAADATGELAVALRALQRAPATLQLRLAGLAEDEVEQLLGTLHLTDAAPAGDLRARTGGNPFHLRQLAEVVRDGGDVASVPPGVRHVLTSRLDRLPAQVRSTLDVCAVLGPTTDPRLVAAVADRPVLEVLDDLATAAEHGLVLSPAPREPVAFVHALIRETILAELPVGRLVRLHATAGETLAARPDPPLDEVAEHLWQAADVVGTTRAVDALRAAAAGAYRVYASERAEQRLRQALDLLGHDGGDLADRELAVRVQLIHVLKGVHGWTADVLLEHLDQLRSLSARLGASVELLPLWWSLWALHMTRGELDEALRVAADLLAGADPGIAHSVVAGHVAMGYTRMFRSEDLAVVLDHVAAAEEAHDHASPEGLDSVPEHLSLALAATRALAHALEGDAGAAMAAVDHAVAVADARGEPFRMGYARLFGAWCAALLDMPALSAEHGDAGIGICEQADLPAICALIEPSRSWARARIDDDPRPWIERARSTDAALVAAGQRHAVPHGRLLLAEVEALTGDPAASRTLAAARDVAEQIGERVYTAQFARVQRLLDTTTAAGTLPRPGRSAPPARADA